MSEKLIEARQNFIQGMSRISHFWGFPRAMGAIYGAIYLSPTPISLDAITSQVGVTKGSVSTNVRTLERLGIVHKRIQIGDRKDYYEAESDFWKVIRGVLREREKQEFNLAIRTVGESLEMVEQVQEASEETAELAIFYQQRLENMKQFFDTLDNIVGMLIALDELRFNSVQKLFGK